MPGVQSATGRGPAGSGRREALLAFLLYALLATGMTWPLLERPQSRLHGNGDVYGNVWAMSWVAHQLPRDPLRLFESNMYFPHAKSLGYAESLLPQGLQALVVIGLGGSAALAYNLVLVLTFPVAGLGAMLLARELGATRGPAFLAGLGFAFCAYRWDHLVHVQSLSCGWLPFVLLYGLRTLRRPSLGSAVGAGAFAWLQVLSSGYYAFLVAVAVALLVATEALRGRRETGRLPAGLWTLARALLVATVAAAPVFLQHREVTARHGFARGVAEMWVWSAGPLSWLDPGPYTALPHARLLHAVFADREPLYPGLVFLVAGLSGLALAGRRTPAGLCAALLGAGVLLASGAEWRLFGLDLPGPFALVRLLPGGLLLRTPARFGVLGLLGLDLLAALALTRLQGWISRGGGGAHAGAEAAPGSSRPRASSAVMGGLALFAILEAWPAGVQLLVKGAPPFPPAAAWLREAPRGAVLELPWSEPEQAARYVYWSTAHWQPLVNGYGSFDPPGNFALGLLGRRFPSGYTSRQFRRAGIRYVVLHTDRLDDHGRARVLEAGLPEGVTLAAELGPDRIYEIHPAGPSDRESRVPEQGSPEKEKGPQLN